MRQLVFLAPGRLEWQDTPEPAIQDPRDAIVRPIAVALCDIDRASLTGRFPFHGPVAFGHEFVAEVLECGDAVTGLSTGQQVIAPVQISCGTCPPCRAGLTAHCSTIDQPAAFGLGAYGGHWPGAFSDQLRVPFADHMLVEVPSGLAPDIVASAGDNLPDAWRTVAPHVRDGDEVLIAGGGSIGLYAIAIAHACRASRVVYVDSDPTRCEVAEQLGAEIADVPPGRRAGTFPVTVSANLTTDAARTAIHSTQPEGHCTLVFPPGIDDVALPLWDMWRRGITFHIGVANCRAHMDEVLHMVSRDAIRPELVTSEIIGWDDADEALSDPTLKPVVVRDPK